MKAAFTLTEVLIVIILISILSALAAPIGIGYVQGGDVENVTRQMVNDFVEYQQNSYTKSGKVFGSSTDVCFGIDISTLSQRYYTLFNGNWDSSTNKCNITKNSVRKINGNTQFVTATKVINFMPGSFRPIPLTQATIYNVSSITDAAAFFTNTVQVGESVAIASAPSTCANITSVTSSTINFTPNLGDGTPKQTLFKCINIMTKNGNNSYTIYVTDEGSIYYKKV